MSDDTNSRNENRTGCFLGYDPGGNGNHGVAAIKVESGRVAADPRVATKKTVEEVLEWFETWFQNGEPDSFGPVLGIGIDTLTYWSSGESGLRMADHCLRHAYPKKSTTQTKVAPSVISPNGLRGAMCLNGMFVLRRLRREHKRPEHREIYVTETHPKVLYRALAGEKYDYGPGKDETEDGKKEKPRSMNRLLTRALTGQNGAAITDCASKIKITNDHEWDALISAWAAFRGKSGEWSLNLLCKKDCDQLVERITGKGFGIGEECGALDFPAGKAKLEYRWPHPDHPDHAPLTG